MILIITRVPMTLQVEKRRTGEEKRYSHPLMFRRETPYIERGVGLVV